MAGTYFEVTSGEVASGTTKKHILSVQAPSGRRVLVKAFGVSFKGTNSSASPVLVEIGRTTSSPYSGTTVTPVKKNADDAESLSVQCMKNFTDALTIENFRTLEVHPQAGEYSERMPFGESFPLRPFDTFVVSVTAAADVNCTAWIEGEE